MKKTVLIGAEHRFVREKPALITSLLAKSAVLNTVLFAKKRSAEHKLFHEKDVLNIFSSQKKPWTDLDLFTKNMVLSTSHVCENTLSFAELWRWTCPASAQTAASQTQFNGDLTRHGLCKTFRGLAKFYKY